MSTFEQVLFEKVLANKMIEVRQLLADNDIGAMRLDIEVSGRTMTGDLEIRFILGTEYEGKNAKGGNLDAVVTEFIRREKWRHQNAPLCLPKVPPTYTNSTDDDPF